MKGEKCNKDLSSLSETNWIVKILNGQPPLSGRPLTLNFENGRVFGSAGCNSYSGGYTASSADKTLDMSPLISTRMMCHEPAGVMEQENNFLIALEAAATYRIEAGWLTIRKADGSSAVRFFKA